MRVNDVAVTIIGVTPPGFRGDIVGQPLDFWLPMMMDPAIQPRMNLLNDRGWSWVVMMGRLKPGVTLEQARQQVSAVEANAIRENLSGRALSQFEDGLKGNPIHVVSGARGFSERRAEYAKGVVGADGGGRLGHSRRLRERVESHARARRRAQPRDDGAHDARRRPRPVDSANARRGRVAGDRVERARAGRGDLGQPARCSRP